MEGREKKRGSPQSHKKQMPHRMGQDMGNPCRSDIRISAILGYLPYSVQDDPVDGARVEMAALTLRNWFYFCFIPHTVHSSQREGEIPTLNA